MDAKTLTALKGSITKWEKIMSGDGTDEGVYNCPLCQLFFWYEDGNLESRDCLKCPVSASVHGMCNCDRTPYIAWSDHQIKIHHNEDFPRMNECPTCLTLAQAELDFLKSLLPKER